MKYFEVGSIIVIAITFVLFFYNRHEAVLYEIKRKPLRLFRNLL